MRSLMRTIVYVDGFNLYYGALKGTPYKWLDLALLFKNMLQPHHDIQLVRYFTAKLSVSRGDRAQSERQNAYLRALRQHRNNVLKIHLGHFLTHEIRLPLVRPKGMQKMASVWKTEEKGSDVNLAVHLLNDAWTGKCDCAVVVTNDSDIAEAMRLIKEQHIIRIGLVTPGKRKQSKQLKYHADFIQRVRAGALRESQLPNPIPQTNIFKPQSW